MRRRTCSDIEDAGEVFEVVVDPGALLLLLDKGFSSALWDSGLNEAVASLLYRRQQRDWC